MSVETVASQDQYLLSLYRADITRYPRLSREETTDRAVDVFRGINLLQKAGVIDTFTLPEVADDELESITETCSFDDTQQLLLSQAYRSCNQLFVSNLRYVVHLSDNFIPYSDVPRMDLIQQGNIGLSRAVHKYDYRKGFRLTTYARQWILQEMQRVPGGIGQSIEIPVAVRRAAISLEALGEKIEAHPDIAAERLDWITRQTGLSDEDIRDLEYVRTVKRVDSLARPLSADNEKDLEATIEDISLGNPNDALDVIMGEQFQALVYKALADRPELIETIQKTYGLNGYTAMTQEELGIDLGLTHQAISRRLLRASELVCEYLTLYGIELESIDL
ncbi:sigma-70 family RNA polymerase sigma factor [Candidatus Saccharibacteria bacterium]|nr:sigma-70 family RNA polymerase sigma factor [Candidatus Saccharibacteria bacterium]